MRKQNTHFYHVTIGDADNEVEICLEYTATDFTPATHFDPAEGGEIEIVDAWIEPGGKRYELTDEQRETWGELIFTEHDFNDRGDDGI